MVETSPHGEGDVRDHINKEYDPDEDGLIEIGELDGVDDVKIPLSTDGNDYIMYSLASNRVEVYQAGVRRAAFAGTVIIDGAMNMTGGTITNIGTTQISEQDLTVAGAPAPTTSDVYATHDGTGAPAAGLYRSDSANNQWVKVEDNTVTIAY